MYLFIHVIYHHLYIYPLFQSGRVLVRSGGSRSSRLHPDLVRTHRSLELHQEGDPMALEKVEDLGKIVVTGIFDPDFTWILVDVFLVTSYGISCWS